MPIYYHSSSRKSNGFSIDDIIKHEEPAKPSLTWLSPPPLNLYQFQRESMLQYLRHTNPGVSVATALFLNSYRKPKRNRTAFTPSQLMKLEDEFEKNHYIVGQERKDLAKHLNLPEAKVKVWYQNRRTKHKRLITDDHPQNESDTSNPSWTCNSTLHSQHENP